MLEYRENQVRSADGTLLAVQARWVADAEWLDGDVVVSVVGSTADEAWALLRQAAHAAAGRPGEVRAAARGRHPAGCTPAPAGG